MMENNEKEKKSVVWDYFKKENNTCARCTLCTKILKHGGNTTNLMQHLKRKHPLHPQPGTMIQRQKKNTTKESSSTKKRMYERNEEEQDEEVDNPDSIIDVSSTTQHKVTIFK